MASSEMPDTSVYLGDPVPADGGDFRGSGGDESCYPQPEQEPEPEPQEAFGGTADLETAIGGKGKLARQVTALRDQAWEDNACHGCDKQCVERYSTEDYSVLAPAFIVPRICCSHQCLATYVWHTASFDIYTQNSPYITFWRSIRNQGL